MIVYKDWGQHLRFGNWLFNYCALLTIAKRSGHQMEFPPYFAWQYMTHPPTIDIELVPHETFPFRSNLYSREEMDYLYQFFTDRQGYTININLGPNNQSELWFQDELEYIKEMITFTPEAINRVRDKYSQFFTKPTIGIGIRRGDFVGHGCFYQIPEDWYMKALEANFPDWKDYNVVVFSDDIDWCREYYKDTPFLFADPNGTHTHADNFTHYHKDPMEQFILGTLMDNFIGGSSTFTWWQMWYVKNFNEGTVVHSTRNLAGECHEKFYNPDFYPTDWVAYDCG